jgi:hypothetical protein
VNPAPVTHACIYIIHNNNSNETYVGYADDANDRWSTRTEAFHCMGIEVTYGAQIFCAYCYPTVKPGSMLLKGTNNVEHHLIRAVVTGLLGVTTNTNTQMGALACSVDHQVNEIRVYLPTDPWGHLHGRQRIFVTPGQHY